MQFALFVILGFIWLSEMAWMVTIAPIGKHPFLFSVLFGLGHVLMILMVRWFPKNMAPVWAFFTVLVVGILGRFVFLFYPVGNDIFRYVWEGYVQTQGFNPYSHAPDSPVLTELARGQLSPIWQQINHPEFPAAYPPFGLLLLAPYFLSPFITLQIPASCALIWWCRPVSNTISSR